MSEPLDLHRDLVSRLGFGDNITEPMADNDTIAAWFEEQGRDASEWRETQRWRDECYAAGHPDDEDCWEHDPRLRLERAEADLAEHKAMLHDAKVRLDTQTDMTAKADESAERWYDRALRLEADLADEKRRRAAEIAAAEQRGREDNADHGQCYVHGSKALAALIAEARAEGCAGLRAGVEAFLWALDNNANAEPDDMWEPIVIPAATALRALLDTATEESPEPPTCTIEGHPAGPHDWQGNPLAEGAP